MKERMTRNNKQKEHSPEGSDRFLTAREMEILQMVTAGYSNGRIADQLGISPLTVKTHIYNACKKIKAPGRLQAALWTIKNL